MTHRMSSASEAFSTSLLGRDWSAYEGCSLLGVIIRLSRLNFMRHEDMRGNFGIVIYRNSNLVRRLLGMGSSGSSVSEKLAFDKGFVADWDLGNWWPFRTPPIWDAIPATIRHCPICSSFGYHSALFHLPDIERCPWHLAKLIEGCRYCKSCLVESFREGFPLLQCSCGHDHIRLERAVTGDYEATEARRRRLAQFRTAARRHHGQRWLFGPGQWDVHGREALAALMGSPEAPLHPSEHLLIESVNVRVDASKDVAFGTQSGLDEVRPTVACLPRPWSQSLQIICSRTAAMLNPKALSLQERKILGAPKPDGSLELKAEGVRSGVLRLRPSVSGGGTFLHTEVLGGPSLSAISAVAAAVVGTPGSTHQSLDHAAFRRAVAKHPLGQQLVSRVIYRLLTRAYADGCRMVLGQIDPDMYRTRSTRPVRRFPWISLNLAKVPSARIAWTRQLNE